MTGSILSGLGITTNKIKFSAGIVLLLLLGVACDSSTTSGVEDVKEKAPQPTVTGNHANTPAALNSTLAGIRSATSQYHDVENAEADGYEQVTPFIPGMGYHYLNFGLLDGNINLNEPEALVYVDNPADDSKRRLVAVEYIIPKTAIPNEENLPDLFSGDSDHWHFESEINSWTQHAWVWFPNPEGVFHPTNPRVGSGS